MEHRSLSDHLQSLKIVAWCLRAHYLVSVTDVVHHPKEIKQIFKLEQIGTSTFLAARADKFLSNKIVYYQ